MRPSSASNASSDPIEVLVNNAGIDVIQPFVDSTEETWERLVQINLLGTVRCTRAVLDGMRERGRGRIISLGSDAGRVGSSGEVVYSATKGGVIAFTKALAREVARDSITVNCVCPGPTDTALLDQVAEASQKLYDGLARAIPLRRIGQPTDIAPAVGVPRLRRRRLHHRPDAVGQRRPHDGLTPATAENQEHSR